MWMIYQIAKVQPQDFAQLLLDFLPIRRDIIANSPTVSEI